LTIRIDFFELDFEFNPRNRFDSTRFSIPTLEIDLSRLSSQVNSNRQHSNRLIDPTQSIEHIAYPRCKFSIRDELISNGNFYLK